jgi:hypothetical protein
MANAAVGGWVVGRVCGWVRSAVKRGLGVVNVRAGGFRGIGPALAGNVGAGRAFARSREGDQDVDVPMLAPARSRCRFVVRSWAGRLGEGEAFGVPQRGTAYQPGVKPRVWRTTGAF